MTIDFEGHRILTDKKTIYLTNSQVEILFLLYKHENEVVTYEEIVKKLYNTNMDDGLKRIIRKHISLLNKRIEEYIEIKNVRDVGYIIEKTENDFSFDNTQDNILPF